MGSSETLFKTLATKLLSIIFYRLIRYMFQSIDSKELYNNHKIWDNCKLMISNS